MEEPEAKQYLHDILENKNYRPVHIPIEDQLLIKAVSNAEFLDLLRREKPKLYDRMRGKLESAKRDLIRLYRKQQRKALCREIQRLDLDPTQPLPRELAEKHEDNFRMRVQDLEKQLDEVTCPVFNNVEKEAN